jgi:hypothetical protein
VRLPRSSIWFVASGCVAALAILTAILFLIPSVSPPPPVRITSIDWQLEQTPPQDGVNEFAELWINQSGPFWGFPFDLPVGGTFNDSLVIVNDESYNVPICTASISPPLYIVSTFPPLPMRADLSEDNLLTLTIGVHANAGATVNATGTISGLGCNLP